MPTPLLLHHAGSRQLPRTAGKNSIGRCSCSRYCSWPYRQSKALYTSRNSAAPLPPSTHQPKTSMPAPPEISRPHPGELATLLRGEMDTIAAWSLRWTPAASRFRWPPSSGRRLLRRRHGPVARSASGTLHRHQISAHHPAHHARNCAHQRHVRPVARSHLPFRQSFSAVVMSFTVNRRHLCAFSPIMAFVVWSAPPMTAASFGTYSVMLLAMCVSSHSQAHAGNLRLFQLLLKSGARPAAWRVLCAWLAGNFFSAASSRGFCARSSARRNLPVSFSATTPCTAIFTRPSLTPSVMPSNSIEPQT